MATPKIKLTYQAKLEMYTKLAEYFECPAHK